MRRLTKHDYAGPGSFSRLLEACISVADCDTGDDRAYQAACMRLRHAAVSYAAQRPPHVLEAAARAGRRAAGPNVDGIDRVYDASPSSGA